MVEIGCGAGRLLGYLSEISEQAEGIDVSSSMVQYCRSNFPAARVALGDLRSLDASLEGSFDVVLASDNILDILDDSARRSVLEEIRERHLAPAGLLVFSTHNLAFMDAAAVSHPGPSPPSANGGGNVSRAIRLSRKALSRSPTEAVRGMARLRREKANRRRLGALEYRAGDHAVLNDVAHEFGLLHYYIRRDDQQRQLEQLGFELCECLELDGGVVPAGRDGVGPSLYYVASAR